jgi:polysaccharide pyruvyl transferase WcaK-like protein
MRPSVVILNDTSGRSHHGCSRVMRLLNEGLVRHGLNITARSPARHDWERDAAFLQKLAAANVVVINGEGTLHHGKKAGEKLLRVVGHPATQAPVALINALWQDNPSTWNEPLSRLALRVARDSVSASTMAQTGLHARWLPDLSLSVPITIGESSRSGFIVGDSVRLSVRRALALAAVKLPNVQYLPTKTLRGAVWRNACARSVLFRFYNGVFPLVGPAFNIAKDEDEYINRLAGAEGQITGRFHAVCLSMLTRTPFLAVSSNASKIERLLLDAELGTQRMCTIADLKSSKTPPAFNKSELTKISSFLKRAQYDAELLYQEIAALSRKSDMPRPSI